MVLVFAAVFIYTFSDIVQDVIKLQTSPNVLGDMDKNLASLPKSQKVLFEFLTINSFFTKVFLLIAIPHVFKRKTFYTLDRLIIMALVFLIVYFMLKLFLS